MKATIWHNPKCGTSRTVLAALEGRDDIELDVVEYLKDPPSGEKLAQLYRDAGIAPREGLRTRGTDAEERGLTGAADDAVLNAMAAEPILIERPLVETEKGVRLCRPAEKVNEIL
jgi:arsenate reductase